MFQFLAILIGAQKAKTDQRGASAVEYGLLVALIAVAIILAVVFLGNTIKGVFSNAGSEISSTRG